MKHEWRKHEKELYIPKQKPELLDVPKQKFFAISGKGNPNSEGFARRIEVLYALTYAVRMMYKSDDIQKGYFEYTVYPLEGVWDLSEKGRQLDYLDKNELIYTIMIRQPEFVTQEVANRAFEIVRKKKKLELLDNAEFTSMEDGLAVQMLHLGSYDNEAATFASMKDFIKDNNLEIKTLVHREIYLSDARKVAPEKLKTVLRYRVSRK
ncbi:MAG: GyrI-like domain-containing protein [Sarcina sp.]